MGAEKVEDRRQDRGIAKAAAKLVRGQPGQREQALRPPLVLQHPAERGQGQDIGRLRRG